MLSCIVRFYRLSRDSGCSIARNIVCSSRGDGSRHVATRNAHHHGQYT